MNVHRILALAPSLRLDKARADSLDLHARLRLLLDVLDEKSLRARISSVSSTARARTHSGSDDLGANVEVPQRFELDEQLLLRPLPLQIQRANLAPS